MAAIVNGELKVKKDWEIKKLGDICEFRRGLTYSKNDEVENSSNAVLRSNNIDLITNRLDLSEIKYISDKIKIDETKKVKRDSLLICTANGSKAHLGKVALIDDDYDFAFGGFMGLLIPSESVYPRFFYYALISENYKKFIKSLSDGANINNLKFQDLSKFEVPVPPREEQKRIVKILDEKIAQLETIKTNAQTNLQNAKDLFQSQLTKAFSNTTWEKAKLEDIALDFSRGKSKHRPRNDKCLFGGDYPFIQTGDIRNADKYVTDYTETYNETGLAQSKLWPKGTLCITIAANIAETAILSFPCCFPDSVIGFIPNEKLTTVDFVYYLIQFFKSELQKMSKGAAQDNLNLAKFENMNFPLPPLPEQKRIVEQLDSLSEKTKALQNIYEQMLLDCEELKQSFLCKAFAGEL